MKKIFLTSVCVFFFASGFSQNIGINTDGTVAEAGVMLDLKSTNLKATTATPTMFQIKSYDAIGSELKMRMIFHTDATAANMYGAIDVVDMTGTVYRYLVFQPSGGFVGIGTTAPAANLHINYISGGANIDVLKITGTNTTNAQSMFGIEVLNKQSGTGATDVVGGRFVPEITATSGTTTNHYGVVSIALNSGNGGTVTNSYGGIFRVEASAGATITNGYGLYVQNANLGAGTVTNKYALVTGPTAGNVGIGVTAPLGTLSVVSPNATGTGTSSSINLTATSLTTGSAMDVTATYAPTTGPTINATNYSITNAPTVSADVIRGQLVSTIDNSALANTIEGIYGYVPLTGNAAKTAYGVYGQVTSSSTTADALYGTEGDVQSTGILSAATTRNLRGLYGTALSSGANTGGTTNIFGVSSLTTLTNSTNGSTVNMYGVHATSSGVAAASTAIVNQYGLYAANGTSSTNGTSTKYGLFVETQNGADANYAGAFQGGNVGIGTITPASLLHVAGAAQLGTISATTGSLAFYNSASANATTLQAGNATAAVNYTLPTAAPAANGYALTSTTAGVMSWGAMGGTGVLIGNQIFTANGTYVPTAGTTKIIVEIIGGGGGGGGGSAQMFGIQGVTSAGGGAGAYTCKMISTVAAGGNTIVIGAGGAGGAADGGAARDGSAGGTSSFLDNSTATTYTASGGSGGAGFNNTTPPTAPYAYRGGNGGAASIVGDIKCAGGAGGAGIIMVLNDPSNNEGKGIAGKGGDSHYGAGPPGIPTLNATHGGYSGTAYGTGASGVISIGLGNGGAKDSGDGAAGVVIVWEYK